MIALLDTNAYTALARGNETLLEQLSQTSRILMSSIVVGELEYGFHYGNRYGPNRARLDEFLAESYVDFLIITRDTTIRYGRICSELRRAGRMIPSNDAWIAAHGIEHGATVWSRDRHFHEVAGISVRDW